MSDNDLKKLLNQYLIGLITTATIYLVLVGILNYSSIREMRTQNELNYKLYNYRLEQIEKNEASITQNLETAKDNHKKDFDRLILMINTK